MNIFTYLTIIKRLKHQTSVKAHLFNRSVFTRIHSRMYLKLCQWASSDPTTRRSLKFVLNLSCVVDGHMFWQMELRQEVMRKKA